VPLSLGLETYGGLMSTLISRNTRIPAVAREIFTTFVDNQTGVDVHVLQGERDRVEDNRSLAKFKLNKLQPSPAGIPRVEVSFLIDADGILQVAARDIKTGHQQSVEVRPSYGLNDEEVEKMLMASLDHAEEDVSHRKLIEAKNEAQIVLRAGERQIKDAYRLLPKDEAQAIEKIVVLLRHALEGTEIEKIKSAVNVVNSSTVELAGILMKEALQSSLGKGST